jgi:hypothetical protein
MDGGIGGPILDLLRLFIRAVGGSSEAPGFPKRISSLRRTGLTSDFDLADLHGWLRVRVVRDVAHDCIRMRAKSLLKSID